MAKGKHEAPSRQSRSRSVQRPAKARAGRRMRNTLPLLAALVLVLGVAAGGTMAYLTDSVSVEGSRYEAGLVSCQLQDNRVRNTGNVDAYVKVVIAQSYLDAEGNVCPDSDHPVPQVQAGEGWVALGDGFSLCSTSPVAPGQLSAPIPTGSYFPAATVAEDGCVAVLNISTFAIQAQPVDAVADAWGYVPGA